MDTVGKRLIKAREKLGMTQTEFAEQAGIKIAAYNNYEHDRRIPSLAEAKKLVTAYGLTLDYIYLGRIRGADAQ